MNILDSEVSKKKKYLEKFAKFGFLTKGVVYFLIGILATMTAFGLGGGINGKQDIIKLIFEQPFGQILVGITALGLLGYAVWQWIQTFFNPEGDYSSDDKKDKVKRVAYFFSGLIYGASAVYAFKLAISGTSSSGGGSGSSNVISYLLDLPAGQIIVGIMALSILLKGGYDIYRGIAKKFMDKIEKFDYSSLKLVERTGQVGYIARGIVLSVISYFLAWAALESNPDAAKGTEGAFKFLFSNLNAWLVGLIAVGVMLYGVFLIIKAKKFHIN